MPLLKFQPSYLLQKYTLVSYEGKDLPMSCHADREEAAVQLYSFFNLGAGCGRVVKVNPPPLYPWERFLVFVLQEAVWGPAPDWRDVEK